MCTAVTDSTDLDTPQVQVVGYEANTQNEELQDLLEDEDVAADNIGTYVHMYAHRVAYGIWWDDMVYHMVVVCVCVYVHMFYFKA